MIFTQGKVISLTEGYGLEIPFALNLCLLIYTVYKFTKLELRDLTSFRSKVHCLILLAILARCSYEAKLTYNYFRTGDLNIPEPVEYAIFSFLDNLPILILITIVSLVVDSWYQLYLHFKNLGIAFEKNESSQIMVTALNLLLYLIFIILIVLFDVSNFTNNALNISALSVELVCLVLVIVALLVIGQRLQKEAIVFAEQTEIIVWSPEKFRVRYLLLVTCCILKVIQLITVLYSEANGYSSVIAMLDDDQGIFLKHFLDILQILLAYIGESGSYFCFLQLLNTYKSQIQAPLQEDSETTEMKVIF